MATDRVHSGLAAMLLHMYMQLVHSLKSRSPVDSVSDAVRDRLLPFSCVLFFSVVRCIFDCNGVLGIKAELNGWFELFFVGRHSSGGRDHKNIIQLICLRVEGGYLSGFMWAFLISEGLQ